MISSCSKEEFYEDEISVIPQTAIEAKSKKILINDIDNPILKQVLNGIKTGQLNRGYSDSTIIEIEDQFATYIESKDGNYHSYTFYVTNTPKDEGLENVLFSLNRSGGYDVFLVRYDVTEADIDALAHGETNTSDWKPNYYLLDQDLNVVDPIAFISKENACVHVAVNYLCKFGNHPGGMLNGEPCPGYQMVIMVSYNDCGGGSSSGGEDSGGDPIGGEDSGGIEWDNTPGGGGPYIPDPEQVITEPLVCRGNCVENPWMSEFETQLNTANLLSCWNNFDTAQQGVVEEFIVSDYGSEASMDFALEGVSAICSNGEVDWKNKIIKDPSFIDTKAECVLDELISTGNNLFKETTDQFTENNSKFKLKFAVGTTTQGGSAQTSSPDNNGIVTITFNPNDLNANSLHIASTILHESIHAELKRIVATNNQGSNPLPTAYYNYLYQLHQYWTDNSAPNFVWSHTEHNYMATQHVIPIANSVRQFDENTHPLENYMEFAWSGLYLEGLLGNPPVVTEAQQTEYANLALIPLNDEHQSQCDE